MKKQKFIVFHEFYGPEGFEIEAWDHKEAAEEFAEQDDQQGEYRCIGGKPLFIEVLGSDGTRKKYRVEGEAMPAYHAYEQRELNK